MKPFTFTQRVCIAMGAVLGIAWLTSPLLSIHWMITAAILGGDLLVAWGAGRWLIRYLNEEHGHFLNVLRDLHQSLETGREGMLLKCDRSGDSFGQLAGELNRLVTETSRQISEQLEQNRQLEQNKTLFQSILGTMIEAVLVLDAEHRVLYFNDAARIVLRSQDRKMEGRPVWEVLRSAELIEAINAVYETGNEFRKELQLSRSKIVVEVTAVPLPLLPRPGVVVVLHEVTELRSLERMRREFVSNVSHELKTPLTSIQACADTLLDGGLSDPENNRRFVERILEQSDRLQALIQDMLRLARIESQSEAFQLRAVSLGKTLESCVDARLAVARSRQVELRLDANGPGVEVLADASGLQTIFDNLISNALNYTVPGGRVYVRWYCTPEEAVTEVEDTGIGIPAEHLDRIFERFYRVDKARSLSVGGTGLGLAIVKHLVSVFGGSVEVTSTSGKGSLFRVRLPIMDSSAQSESSEPESAARPQSP